MAALATVALGLPAQAAQAVGGKTTVLQVKVAGAAISGIPKRMPGGEYTFKATQTGGGQLQLGRLRNGYTAANFVRDFNAADPAAFTRLYAGTVFEGGTGFAPRGQFTAFLTPGTYLYASLGAEKLERVGTVVVTEAGKTAPDPPRVDVTVVGYEDHAMPHHFGWDVKGVFARQGKLRFKAAGTHQPHFIIMFKLKGGASVEDCFGFQGPPADAPCFPVLDTGVLSPNEAMVVPYALPSAGRYFLACFLPDPGAGMKDHATLGMTKVVNVR
ncbi:MAG TPA: hypothetical protein VFR07_17425 [Mycobacteriales bacterium]|nr:hypothetical protein [Mycobacteriales bacterium]